jgi:hypothetical protein
MCATISVHRFDFNVDDLSYEVTPSTLLQDMHSFINNEALSDVEFIVEGETIYAHKMMLVRYVNITGNDTNAFSPMIAQ